MIDSKQLERHFSYEELAQLYEFNFDLHSNPIDRSDIDRIEDRILQNLIKKHSDTIVSYCEHDSFLIHRQEENLTEEEQKEAQDEGCSIQSISFSCISLFFSPQDMTKFKRR